MLREREAFAESKDPYQARTAAEFKGSFYLSLCSKASAAKRARPR
jgi:hypothetical protein